MLNVERLTDLTGRQMPGFFVRNKAKKLIAIGAFAGDNSFVMPAAKRYAADVELCGAIAALTGVPIKWNLSFHGKYITSGSRQAMMANIKNRRGL